MQTLTTLLDTLRPLEAPSADEPLILQEHAAGRLLVASPLLMDATFSRTLLLLANHDLEGSMGFIINRPTELLVENVLEGFPRGGIPIYEGGPVGQDTLHYLHTLADLPDSQHLGAGVYWGGDFEELQTRVLEGKATAKQVRFFMGYSGWEGGQLDHEVTEDESWLVTDYRQLDIFTKRNPDVQYVSILRRMGGPYKLLATLPPHPMWN